MRRPAFTLIFLGLAALILTEGLVVFRFLKNAADATQLMSIERQLAQEASGLTRKVMAGSQDLASPRPRVALEDEQAEYPGRRPASPISASSSVR